ncbi:MAG: flavin-containing monooxygenase [Paracoccaceae bacterium]
MTIETTNTVIVGGGQAGLAASAHMGMLEIPHIVLERDRIAESWRTRRWDSLVANGPAWHDRFPAREFDVPPDSFASKEDVAAYFEGFAQQIEAPIRCGVEVQDVQRLEARTGFRCETSQGVIETHNVIAATGPFQIPVIPPLVPENAPFHQIHSHVYYNPTQLPEGGVLVVGAGSSGSQIAEELMRSGRRTYLSVGPHNRPPRSYRGLDFCWWLGVLGEWDVPTLDPRTAHITIAVSGANGGRTVDFRRLASEGMVLVGMASGFENGLMTFAPDLAKNIAAGDANHIGMLDKADAYAAQHGLDLPDEPDARHIGPDPDCVTSPLRQLDLAAAGISTIIWATGYRQDFGWLNVNAFGEDGKPDHHRGISAEPGVYFLGLPWLSRRASSFIWGVWHDAKHIADHIAVQRGYQAHRIQAQGSI